MITGKYNGSDYESLEIVPSDPSAFELISSSDTPLGEEYLFIFNLKALKAGDYTLGVTDGYTNNDFLAIEGSGIDQAVLDMGSGIKLSGSDYQFKAFVSTDPVS